MKTNLNNKLTKEQKQEILKQLEKLKNKYDRKVLTSKKKDGIIKM